MPGEVIAEGEVRVGINLAEFDSQLRTLQTDIDKAFAELSRKRASPTIDADAASFETKLDEADKQLAQIDKRVATPRLDLDVKLFESKLMAANKQLDAFGKRTSTATLNIDTGGVTAAITTAAAEVAAFRAEAERPIQLHVAGAPVAAAGAGAATVAAGNSGGGGAGVLSALLMGHAGGGGGGRFMPWGLRALTGFGIGAGVGSLGSFAGLGADHLLMTMLGLGGSAVGAGLGAGLMGAGALGKLAVGGGSDLAVMKSTIADTKQLSEATHSVAEAVAVYGKNSEQAAHAEAKRNFLMKELAAGTKGAGVKAEQALSERNAQVGKLFDAKTQRARVEATKILTQGDKLAEKFIPRIGHAAKENLHIINIGLKPAFHWLEGPEGKRIWNDLENQFKKQLPTALHAFDQAMQFVLKTIDVASHYTGGFVKMLDSLFTKWNSPEGFKKWEGTMGHLIEDFKVWKNFFKELGRDIFDLFSQDAGTAKAILRYLTAMLAKVGEWERSTKGKEQIHNIFQVHKEEILALLRILPPLITSFAKIYMTVSPPLVEGLTDVARAVANVLKEFTETGPLARWALGIALIAAKLRLLVPALKAVAGLAGISTAGGGLSGLFKKGGAQAASTTVATGAEGAAAGGGLNVLGIAALPVAVAAIGTYMITNSKGSAGMAASGWAQEFATKLWPEVTKALQGGNMGKFTQIQAILEKMLKAPNLPPELRQEVEKELGQMQHAFEHASKAVEHSFNLTQARTILLNNVEGMRDGTIKGLHDIEAATAQNQAAMSRLVKSGSAAAKQATLKGMREEVDAIRKGVHDKTISREDGVAAIKRINREEESLTKKADRQLEAGSSKLGTSLGNTFKSLEEGVSTSLAHTRQDVINLINKFAMVDQNKNIVGKFHAEGIPNLKGGFHPIEGHAAGGHVTKRTLFEAGEEPGHPEWVIATNPAYREKNVQHWAQAGHDLGVPGFAEGGLHEPQLAGPHNRLLAAGQGAIHQGFAAAQKYYSAHRPGALGGKSFSHNSGGGNLSQAEFIAIARAALKMTGHAHVPGGASTLLWVAEHESGLNPNSINTTDENAAHGIPSQGLMEIIPPNFQAYHQRGTSHNIKDPLANVAAAINYMYARYGHLVKMSPYKMGGRVPGFAGGGKVGGAGTDTAVEGWATGKVGQGDHWGYGGEWCGAFLGADMLAHGIQPPGGYPLSRNWAAWGEPRSNADAGTVIVWPNHVGLAIGGGKMVSGNWGGGAGKVAIANISEGPGSIIAKRRPLYGTGTSGAAGSSGSAPTAAQKARARAEGRKGHTSAGGGTYGPYASKHEIANVPIGSQPKSILPAWAQGLPRPQQEELEGRNVSFGERTGILSATQAAFATRVSGDQANLGRLKARAAHNKEHNTPGEEAARGKLQEDLKLKTKGAQAGIKFNLGYIKRLTERIKKINAILKTGKINHKQEVRLIAERGTFIAARQTARGEIASGEETIGEDEMLGEEIAWEVGEEAAAAAEATANAAAEKAAILSEDIASLNSSRWDLLKGNASNILNLASGGELMPGHLLPFSGDLITSLTPPWMGNKGGYAGSIGTAYEESQRKIFEALQPSGSSGRAAAAPGPASSTVNQYVTINTPEVNPHAVSAQLAWNAKVA